MSTKPIKGYRIKDGKLVRVVAFRAKIKAHKTSRAVKAWQAKSSTRQGS